MMLSDLAAPCRQLAAATTHRIDLAPAHRKDACGHWFGQGKAIMTYCGETIGDSRQPLLDAARWLLDHGMAEPGDRIETWRGEMLCMSAIVGVAAKLSVRETDGGGGPWFVRWQPFAGVR